jgi:S-formylglutathione hydrolase FrmB/lysophospholipase L1-like esterase
MEAVIDPSKFREGEGDGAGDGEIEAVSYEIQKPRPEYKEILLLGDSFMVEGLGPVLEKRLKEIPELTVNREFKSATGLVREDYFDWFTYFAETLDRIKPQLVIISLGANDTQDIVVMDGDKRKRSFINTPEWNEEYALKVGRLLAVAEERDVRVLWIGLPIMRKEAYDKRVHNLNEVVEEVCAVSQICDFFSSYELLTDKDGAFTAYVTLPDNTHERIRAKDSIHLTEAGASLIADAFLLKAGEWGVYGFRADPVLYADLGPASGASGTSSGAPGETNLGTTEAANVDREAPTSPDPSQGPSQDPRQDPSQDPRQDPRHDPSQGELILDPPSAGEEEPEEFSHADPSPPNLPSRPAGAPGAKSLDETPFPGKGPRNDSERGSEISFLGFPIRLPSLTSPFSLSLPDSYGGEAPSPATMVEISLPSKARGKETNYLVYLPTPDEKRPTVFLLHGTGEDYLVWKERYGRDLMEMAKELNLNLVMPDGDPYGWYLDSPFKKNSRLELYLMEELWPDLMGRFLLDPDRVGVLGINMGGHGALTLALKYPGAFKAVYCLSGITDLELHGAGNLYENDLRLTDVLGPYRYQRRIWQNNSAYFLTRKNPIGLKGLALSLSVGLSDPVTLAENRQYHRLLSDLGITHEYAEERGDHSWTLWRGKALEGLSFLSNALNG